jgi:hypothetical protein
MPIYRQTVEIQCPFQKSQIELTDAALICTARTSFELS